MVKHIPGVDMLSFTAGPEGLAILRSIISNGPTATDLLNDRSIHY